MHVTRRFPGARRRPRSSAPLALACAALLSVGPAAEAAAQPNDPGQGPLPGSASAHLTPQPEYVAVEPAGDGSPIESGSFAGARNFRDVAGTADAPLRGAGGAAVKRGLAYRSNKLGGATDEDLARMLGAGVTRVVDLRNIRERAEEPDRLPAGVEYQVADVVDVSRGVWFDENPVRTVGPDLAAEVPPIARDAAADGSSDGDATDDAIGDLGQLLGYQLMVTNSASQRAFSDLLHALAHEDGAVVFHCSAGKDRTGVAAAYLLRILGVPMADIDADFLASDAYLGRENSVRLEWLHATWETIDRNYGSFDAYVRGPLGLSDDDIAFLRSKYLEGAAAS